MSIDDMFMDMIILMIMDEQMRIVCSKEAHNPEKVEVDMAEILKAEKMYD